MRPYHEDDRATIYHGDCLGVLQGMTEASIDALVCDPPYGLEFMGKEWDGANGFRRTLNANDVGRDNAFGRASRTSPEYRAGHLFQQWCELWTVEALRVLKPGGHLLAFGGTRTWHRLAVAVEDAGFEIRDSIAWLYGSGFPKSLDVSKAIDKAAGAERPVVGSGTSGATAGMQLLGPSGIKGGDFDITVPATPEAEQWQGWGTALKPAFEPIVVARKPLVGTVAANVLAHGTGALNIDACRIAASDPAAYAAKGASVVGLDSNRNGAAYGEWTGKRTDSTSPAGRWPANVVLDEDQAAALDEQSKGTRAAQASSTGSTGAGGTVYGGGTGIARTGVPAISYGDSGGASRFFYVAKAPKKERPVTPDGVSHPTVKPLALMRWLVRLVTPPGGVVLDPFAGSGTTVEAALLEGFGVIGIEREADYLPMIQQRIERAQIRPKPEPDLFTGEFA